MSLDNVLAVAGAAREHPVRPGLRPAAVDRADGSCGLLHRPPAQRYRWIAYVGLAIILYVSLKMIYEGFLEIYPLMNGVAG